MPAIYPAFESELPSYNPGLFEGKALSNNFDALSEIPFPDGITPLMDFIDAGSMALDVFDEEELPDDVPPTMWHSAADGLASVRYVKQYLAENPDTVSDTEDVTADLNELESALQIAQNGNVRFHLLIDI